MSEIISFDKVSKAMMGKAAVKKASNDSSLAAQLIIEKESEKTPVTLLQEMLIKVGQTPVYETIPGNTIPISFMCTASCMGKEAIGTGKSKKDAKHAAAKKIIELLLNNTNEGIINQEVEKAIDKADDDVKKLQLMCQKHNVNKPQYIEGMKTNSSSGILYHCYCVVTEFHTEGEGQTYELAMQDAAKKMIKELSNFFTASSKGKTTVNAIFNFSDVTSNESLLEKQIDSKLLVMLKYVCKMAKDCLENLKKKEAHTLEAQLFILRKEFQQFLKSANIDFYHMVIKTSQPETYMYLIQVNSPFELLEMSLGQTQCEAEIRSVGKIMEKLREKLFFRN